MCCNNRNRCCRCCCGASENNRTTSSDLFSGLTLSDLSGTAGGRQVYLTIPAFLWAADQEEEDTSCGCGCCRCCRAPRRPLQGGYLPPIPALRSNRRALFS